MFCRSYDYLDPFDMFGGDIYTSSGEINRNSFAPVSDRAKRALDNAKSIFLKHLAAVDTSKGPVTEEIIRFHLVPDMKKAFNKFVKEYGCTATTRKITREEQDKINKTRKSLMNFTSVNVTPDAQKQYIEKHPHLAKKTLAAGTSAAGEGSSFKPLQDHSTKNLKRSINDAQFDVAETKPVGKKTKTI